MKTFQGFSILKSALDHSLEELRFGSLFSAFNFDCSSLFFEDRGRATGAKMNDLMTKSFTSYVELKKQALKDLEAGGNDIPDAGVACLTHAEEENLSRFFSEIEVIQSEMDDVSSLLLDLQHLHEESKSAHSAKVLRGLRDRMDADVVAVLRKAKNIKAGLESLDRSNIANRGVAACFADGSPVDRTRVSITNALRTKLRQTMNGFQLLRECILAEHRESLKRRYFNATGEVASEGVIDKMLTGRSQVGSQDNKGEVDLEVLERQKAVSDIQRSLTRLHQIFLDMSLMVETQDEQLNDIEENVARARDYISGGTDRLFSANSMKKRNMKFIYLTSSLLLITILVCLILILTDS
ncbi:syntaxin-112 [Canna indica]|uniref:Syntaxin-112 n=1 Tax=Canna indica TaxID=4628 RepID=A0AAQ3JWM1_9LILI|nr:syntaxin-112 [Canna indica]